MGAASFHRVSTRVAEASSPQAEAQAKAEERKALDRLKREFVEAGGLEVAHNAVYEKVGEERWEAHVKPELLGQITRMVAMDTGNPFPDHTEIFEWLRAHPEEAKRVLERTGRKFEK